MPSMAVPTPTLQRVLRNGPRSATDGIGPDLMAAARDAVRRMIEWLGPARHLRMDRGRTRTARALPRVTDLAGQVPVAVVVDVAVLGGFLELVSGTSAGTRANRAADESSGRSGNRAPDESATHRTTGATDARAGLFVTLGSLTGDSTAGRSDGTTDGRTHRSTDHAAHDCPADGARGATDGLATVLVVAIMVMVGRFVRHRTRVGVIEIAIPIVHLE